MRMKQGLSKLIEASESVSRLSIELKDKEKELDVAKEKAQEVLGRVTQQAVAAERVKGMCV